MVAAAHRRLWVRALPDVRGLHGAPTGPVQCLVGRRAEAGLCLQLFHWGPAPAGAGLVLFPLFLGLEATSQGWDWLLRAAQYPLFCAIVLVGTALLLVSPLPIWSFKNFKVPSEYVLPLLLGTGAFAAVLVADPWAALAAAGLIYLCMLPFSVRSFRRLRREAEAPRDEFEAERRNGGPIGAERAMGLPGRRP